MLTVLYIDLREKEKIFYEKEILSKLTSLYPGIVTFDIDYQSENSLVNHAQQLLKESAACILYIESDTVHSHKIVPFAEEFIQNPEKFIVFLEGENSWLTKLSKGVSNPIYTNLSQEKILDLISEFINANSQEN